MTTSVNNTINAAASAIVSAESRVQPSPVQKRRWGGCWSLYWCFGSPKTSKRIGHAVLFPEPEVQQAITPSNETQIHSSTSISVPFIAPPSSPASFLQSDPPSSTHSPSPPGFLSLTSFSVNSYSPGGPQSIFAIGPYAHETQLVTPPVFSAFTTQPSTAPFTPPPESVQMTSPSSPEVPFAQLLTSSLERARKNGGSNQKFTWSHYEFQSYSPGGQGQLISPGSVISNSGTSSPFPDRYPILEFRMGEIPKLLGFEHFTTRGFKPEETIVDHRVSFELSGEEVARCLESKAMTPCRTFRENMPDDEIKRPKLLMSNETFLPETLEKPSVETEELCDRKHHLVKEFNFDSKEIPDKPTISSEWTFFPLLQPKVS